MPTFRQDVKLGTKVPLLNTDDLSDGSITIDKLDPPLRNFLPDGPYMEALTNDEIDTLWISCAEEDDSVEP